MTFVLFLTFGLVVLAVLGAMLAVVFALYTKD